MIKIVKDDILKIKADAIVNPANKDLQIGSGLSGLIHNAAGPMLEQACLNFAPLNSGNAIITPGFNLGQKFVVHAVGPNYYSETEKAPYLLEQTYKNILSIVKTHNLSTIAIPCISTGIYGFPKEDAALIAYKTVKSFLSENELDVIFCCYEDQDYEIYNLLHKMNFN